MLGVDDTNDTSRECTFLSRHIPSGVFSKETSRDMKLGVARTKTRKTRKRISGTLAARSSSAYNPGQNPAPLIQDAVPWELSNNITVGKKEKANRKGDKHPGKPPIRLHLHARSAL
jgi:hypothetical protein